MVSALTPSNGENVEPVEASASKRNEWISEAAKQGGVQKGSLLLRFLCEAGVVDADETANAQLLPPRSRQQQQQAQENLLSGVAAVTPTADQRAAVTVAAATMVAAANPGTRVEAAASAGATAAAAQAGMGHADQTAAVAAVANVMKRNGISSPMYQASRIDHAVSESQEAVIMIIINYDKHYAHLALAHFPSHSALPLSPSCSIKSSVNCCEKYCC
jgi:hypothetical protein